MRKRVLKAVALLLSLSLLVMTGCGDKEKTLRVADFDGPWIDSDLKDVITENDQFRPQDDFAASVNRDWKLEQNGRMRMTMADIGDAVMAKKKRVISDESITGVEADRLRTFFNLASDWESRNKDGVEPLAKYIRMIDGLENTQALYEWMRNDMENPFALGVVYVKDSNIQTSVKYPDKYMLYLENPGYSLGNASSYLSMGTSDLESYEKLKKEVGYLLGRMGYDEARIDQMVSDALIIEKQMAKTENEDPDIKEEDITYSRAEVIAAAGDYPLDEYLKAWGYKDNDVFVVEKKLLKKASALCTGSNFEKMKSYLIIRYLYLGYKYIDREAYDTFQEMEKSMLTKSDVEMYTDEEKEDRLLYDTYLCATPMVGAMSKLYAENCFDESATAELRDLTQDIIDKFHDVFNGEEWLSEEGKKKCIEKLDAIKIHVVYQDYDSVDYSQMNLVSREEGGNFFEAYMEARRFMERHKAEMSSWPSDRDYWDPMNTQISTIVTNAMYSAQTNGIYILAGICEAPAYSPDMTYEEKLAGICTVIGHEITHGFDSNGSQYDSEGVKKPWLPEVDTVAFNDKVTRLANYFSSLTPFPGEFLYSGNQVQAEETADLGGMTVVLAIAKDVDGFDYDRFFRSYANMWKSNVSLDVERYLIKTDVHPLNFFRINVGMQQYDEFYDTYGIKEGDGMYLNPAKRVKVW